MCGSKTNIHTPHGRLFDLHSLPPRISVPGVFDDPPGGGGGGVFFAPPSPPPPPQEFPKFLNGVFSPPLEIQSGFGSLKKESEY